MTDAQPVDLAAVLRAAMIEQSEIRAIVGENVMMHGTYVEVSVPCIIFQLTGGESSLTLDGPEDEQYPTARMELYANDYDQGMALNNLVLNRFQTIEQELLAGHLVATVAASQAEDRDEPLLTGQTLPNYVFSINLQAWLSRVTSEE